MTIIQRIKGTSFISQTREGLPPLLSGFIDPRLNQSPPQPTWAYCEILGETGLRIKKEGVTDNRPICVQVMISDG